MARLIDDDFACRSDQESFSNLMDWLVGNLFLIDSIRKLETDNEHEERVTAENESFLRDQHMELASKMEAWTRLKLRDGTVLFCCLGLFGATQNPKCTKCCRKYKEDTEGKKAELERVRQVELDSFMVLVI